MKDADLVGAVFDCNVHLQAAGREKSVAAECLRTVEKGLVRLYLSEDVLAEVEAVLNRPEIRNHFQTLTDEVIEAFLLRLQRNSQVIHRIPKNLAIHATLTTSRISIWLSKRKPITLSAAITICSI